MGVNKINIYWGVICFAESSPDYRNQCRWRMQFGLQVHPSLHQFSIWSRTVDPLRVRRSHTSCIFQLHLHPDENPSWAGSCAFQASLQLGQRRKSNQNRASLQRTPQRSKNRSFSFDLSLLARRTKVSRVLLAPPELG